MFVLGELSAEKLYIFEKMKVPGAVMKLVVPSVLSQLVTLIYNVADTFFVGRTGDTYQVAAVSMAYTLYFVLAAIGSLYGIGGGSLISRYLGARRIDRVKKASSFSFYASLLTTLAVSILTYLTLTPVLKVLGASENTFGFCWDYCFWVVVIGGLPTVAALVMGHLLRSEGYSRQAGFGVAFGGILNILLDPVFIFGLHMGVKGAAIATLISNVLAVGYYLLTFRALRGKLLVTLSPAHFRPEREIVGQVFMIGMPAFISTILTTCANTLSFNLISGYGDVPVAAFGVTKKMDLIPMSLCMGIANGILPLIAYNYSSGNHRRMRASFWFGMGIGLCFGFLYLAAGRLFGAELVRLFITADETTVACGESFVHVECLAVPFMVVNNLMNTMFQAMGKGVPSLILSACRSALLKMPATILMNALIGLIGIIWSQFATETAMLIVTFSLFAWLMRRLKRKTDAAPAE